ncbi:hypothetical protein BESB_009710 [Besnoitia besnoiti]|uniref:Tola protein n=1 Tax=Besnoitia besnoiti TaxID=94643 RepID=A0A2A9MKZ0_BESBE|nr:hypothetical protein BESB_009710 [Besnoitia besnoiti]PFH38629.1 hypothetical protein BESB_009710 [Besnoitia besnoiti]
MQPSPRRASQAKPTRAPPKLPSVSPWSSSESSDEQATPSAPAMQAERKRKGPPPLPSMPLPAGDAPVRDPSPMPDERRQPAVVDPGLDDAPVQRKKTAVVRKQSHLPASSALREDGAPPSPRPLRSQSAVRQAPSRQTSKQEPRVASLDGQSVDGGVTSPTRSLSPSRRSGASRKSPTKMASLASLASKVSMREDAPAKPSSPSQKAAPRGGGSPKKAAKEQPSKPSPKKLPPQSSGVGKMTTKSLMTRAVSQVSATSTRGSAKAKTGAGTPRTDPSRASSPSTGSGKRAENAAEKAARRSEEQRQKPKPARPFTGVREDDKLETMIKFAEKAVAGAKEQNDSGRKYSSRLKQLEESRDELQRKLQETRSEAEAEISELRKELAAKESALSVQNAARLHEAQQRVDDMERDLQNKIQRHADEKREAERARERLEKEIDDMRVQHKRDLAETARERQREVEKSEHKLQSMTDTIQSLSTSVAQLQEISDVSRSALQAMEERNKLVTAKLELLTKKDAEREKEMRKMMPTREAKRLAFRALQKGRAVEMIFHALSHANNTLFDKAWALAKMVEVSRLQQIVAHNKGVALASGIPAHSELLDQIVAPSNSRPSAARWMFSVFQGVVRLRLLSGFSALKGIMVESKREHTVRSLQDRFNEMRLNAYNDMVKRISATKIFCLLRILWMKSAYGCMFSLMTNAAGKKPMKNALSEASRYLEPAPTEPFAPDNFPFRVVSGEVQRVPLVGGPAVMGGKPLALGAYKNESFLNNDAPMAMQPYYYGQLPSVQRKRPQNVFIPMQEKPPIPTGYVGQGSYMDQQLTLGVPFSDLRGTQSTTFPVSHGTRLNVAPKNIPTGPYSPGSPGKIDEKASVFRMRTAQQDVQKRLWGGQNHELTASGLDRVVVGKPIS